MKVILAKRLVFPLALPVLLVGFLWTVGAAVPPPPPLYVYGVVTVGGDAVPEGTVVTANCADLTFTTTASMAAGQSVYSLYIPGDDPESPGLDGCVSGDTVSFTITVGGSELPADEIAIWASGDNANVDLTAGLPTFVQEGQRKILLEQNVPNPFNPTTTISFDVPVDAGRVTLTIYDVAGRLVRQLVNANLPAGHKSVLWDGTGDAGGLHSSGVYFYRLSGLGFTQTRKMVLLK